MTRDNEAMLRRNNEHFFMTRDNEAMLRRNNEHLLRANRFLLYLIAGLLGLNAVSLGFAYKLWNHQPEPKLLGLTIDNRVLELPLLNEPFEATGIAQEWAEKNIRRLYTFTYDNLGDLPTLVGDMFYGGEDGGDSTKLNAYIKGMKAQGFFDLVLSQKRLCTAFLSDSARVLQHGTMGTGAAARYGYQIQVPLNVQCKNETNIEKFSRMVTVSVVRASPTRSPDELVIVKVNSSEQVSR